MNKNSLVQVELNYLEYAASHNGEGKEEILADLILFVDLDRHCIFADIITNKMFIVCTEHVYVQLLEWFMIIKRWKDAGIAVERIKVQFYD